MLPPTIPIFPLPNVVLFPNVFLPLHIFEPRYRQMVADALKGDRIIGMVLLKPGWQSNYEGRPQVYGVGCAGVITHAERLPDGRSNIVLRGMEKFRITGEEDGQPYRVAQVETIDEPLVAGSARRCRGSGGAWRHCWCRSRIASPIPRCPSWMPDEDLVNTLAQYLEFEAVEKQALLERDGLLDRCRSLIELLEMKVLVAQRPWESDDRR